MEETVRGIPLTWEGVKHMVWSADVSRDPRLQMEVFWSAFLGKPWVEVAPMFRMREAELFDRVADMTGVTVFTTRDGPAGYHITNMWSPKDVKGTKSAKRPTYLILDPARLPLTRARDGEPMFEERDLPAAIREWIDQSFTAPTMAVEQGADEEQMFDAQDEKEEYEKVRLEAPALPEGPAAQAKPEKKERAKPCKEGEERSKISGKCVKKCKEGEERDEGTGRCRKTRKNRRGMVEPKVEEPAAPAAPAAPTPKTELPAPAAPAPPTPQTEPQAPGKPCPEGQERSAKTRKCIKKCPEGEVRHPDTGRCRKIR